RAAQRPYSGPGWDQADAWTTKYFPVFSYSGQGAFEIDGWGPTGFGCLGGCEGRPDVLSIEPVDGPGQDTVLGNPRVPAPALPPEMADARTTEGPGDPVNVSSGNYTMAHTDLAVPGRGVPLQFTRLYSAQAPASGPAGTASVLGSKWSHNWEASLTEIS